MVELFSSREKFQPTTPLEAYCRAAILQHTPLAGNLCSFQQLQQTCNLACLSEVEPPVCGFSPTKAAIRLYSNEQLHLCIGQCQRCCGFINAHNWHSTNGRLFCQTLGKRDLQLAVGDIWHPVIPRHELVYCST